MPSALVVGGTQFIGRHLVSELLDHGYDVWMFNRGKHDNPFADDDRVGHVQGDRADDEALVGAAEAVDPDVVVDCVAYKPREVETATRVFADADAYVYVSSGSAYAGDEIPNREDETPLEPCTGEQAVDDSWETYGARKAEGDRAVFQAADRGVNAMSVRPALVYGPYDYTERFDYWLHRVETQDRVLVPGDGDSLLHRAYVEDVAAALRLVAERGAAGEAYNVGDRRLVTLEGSVERAAAAFNTSVELVHASARELAAGDLTPSDFPLYTPQPFVFDTTKLAALGWESTPLDEAMARTVEEHVESDRDGSERGPDRADEERVLSVLDTVE